MGKIDSGSKSNRLLASRRYTHNTLNTSQEAFTNVLDLRSEEIYTRAHLIPSSSLPHSGSSQKNAIFTKDGQNVTKYWYRHCLTKSNVNNEVFFFLSPTGSSDGIGPQLIDDNQQTNFISPKYSVSSLANATTEDATPGYLAIVYKSTTTNTASLGGGDIVSTNDYQFDYKTGVLQFKSDSVDPTDSQKLYMTVYQYVGQNLRTGLEVQGPVTASSFSGTFLGSLSSSAQIADDISGSFVAASSSFSTRISTAESELSNTLVSSSAQIATDISGSFTAASSSFSTRVTNLKTDSGSFSTRITTAETELSNTLVSSSAQIASDISGSFVAASSSFSTRISTAESELTNTLVSSSAQIASDISGSWRGWASGSNEHLFGGSVRVTGDVIAENYIVSSSITYMTQSFSSGSNIFGDTGDDTHKFTGSLFVNSGSQDLLVVSSSGRIGIGTLEPGTTVEIVGSVSSSATGSFQHLFVGDRITLNDNQDSGEYIESDGTDININVGTNGDVNIPANIGLTFGNDGEKIEGDGTDLTIASSGKLALDVTTDLEIDVDGGDIKITDDGAHVADISATAISGSSVSTGSFAYVNVTSKVSGSSVSTGSFGRIEVDKLEADTLDTTISNLISGSLGANASLIRSLTATTITGSFTAASSSFSTRITTAETELSNTLVSSSAQIADDISGSFTAASSSFSTRISTAESELTNTLVSSSAQIASDISGSFTAASSSFSTRISTAESELTNTLVSSSAQIASDISGSFTAASSSFSTRISTAESELTNTLVSSSAQIASDISGSFTAASSSFSTRISTAESELTNTLVSSSAQIASDISGSFTAASSSFSTRISTAESELTNTLVSSSAQIASDISGSFTNPSGNVSGSSTSTGSFGKLEVGSGAITTAGNMTLDADGAQIRLEDGGTEFGRLSRVSSDFVIKSMTADKDLLFKGVDDSTTITALSLDMSEGGNAEFSGNVSGSSTSTGSFGRLELGGNANIDGNITLGGSITIGDADTDDISIGGEFTSHLIPNADSTFDLGSSSKNWRFGYIEQVSATHVTASGHITGSSTSTGSFGRVEATTLKGDGSDVTNVTDPNAIAFSIVFGG